MAKRKYVVLTGPVGKETGVISGPHDGAGWTHDRALARRIANQFRKVGGHVVSAAYYNRLRKATSCPV